MCVHVYVCTRVHTCSCVCLCICVCVDCTPFVSYSCVQHASVHAVPEVLEFICHGDVLGDLL